MKLNYKLKQNDFLQHNLYEYSQNNYKKFTNKFMFIYAGIFLVAGILSILSTNYFVAFFFVTITIAIIFITPSRLKDTFFDNSLKKSKEVDIDKVYYIILNEDSIELSSDDFNIKYNIDKLKKIVEVKISFYLIFESQAIIIIPKLENFNITELKTVLLDYSKKNSIKFEDSIKWKY
jgi:hypothetical protein